MTKKLKLTVISILTALMLICVGFLLSPKAVRAEDDNKTTSDNTFDDNFSFTHGASINHEGFADGEYRLGFKFNLKSTKFSDFSSLIGAWKTYNGNDFDDWFMFRYTILRDNGEGYTQTKLAEYVIYYQPLTNHTYYRAVGVKNYTYFDESITVEGIPALDNEKRYTAYTALSNNGYEILSSGVITNTKSGFTFAEPGDDVIAGQAYGVDSTYVNIRVDDPMTSYCVKFDYDYKYWTKEGLFGIGASYTTGKGAIESDYRSIYEILANMQEQGDLEEIFDEAELEVANDIITEASVQTVQIKYLKQIGDTPFATHVYTYVDLPVKNGKIYLDAAASALGIDTFNVLDSKAYAFEYQNGIYVVHYLKNVWLRSIAADGNYLDYFLDINLSYEDYYHQFVEDGVFSNDLYEFIFSTRMIDKYPELYGYKFSEVYGYFGMAVIPNAYTLDSLWAEMFSIAESTVGVCTSFSFDGSLAYESYIKLCRDYGYSWLEQAWNTTIGTLTGGNYSVTYYLFYSDGEKTDAVIGENGATDGNDTSGIVLGGIGSVMTDIGEAASNLWGSITGFIKSPSNIITTIIIIVVIYLVIKLLITNKNTKKRK